MVIDDQFLGIEDEWLIQYQFAENEDEWLNQYQHYGLGCL